MPKELNKQIGNAAKWSTITEFTAKLISPIVNLLLARLLTPNEFGIVATITMVISFAEIFTDAGFQKYVIQHEYSSNEELDRSTNVAFWTNLVFSVVICVGIFIFRNPIAAIVGNPGLGNSISIASILIIITAFSSIQMARYKRALDFKTLFFVRMGSSLMPLIVTLPLALLLRNYWALLIGNFCSQLFSALILTLKSKWRPAFYYNFKMLKEMFSFSAWTLLESISIWLTSYIGVFIVGNSLNDYYLGLYKTSMTTVNSYMALITSALTPVVFSALSRYQNDEVEFRRTYFSFQRLASVFVIPMGIGIYLFRDLVTYLLLGDQWMEASHFVGLWGLTSAFTIVLSHFASEVYRSKGNPKISLIVQIVHLIFLVPTLMISMEYGFEVLYTARTLIRIQLIVTAMIVMHMLYKFEIKDVIRNVIPAAASALIMGVVGWMMQQLNDSILWQFTVIALCIVVYFAALFMISPATRKELLSIPYVDKILNKFAWGKNKKCSG